MRLKKISRTVRDSLFKAIFPRIHAEFRAAQRDVLYLRASTANAERRIAILEQTTSRSEEIIKMLQVQNTTLANQAFTDSLTGTLNRIAGLKIAEMLQSLANKEKKPQYFAGIMILDVDHFKRVNDTHGHENGDRVLQAIVRAIKTTIKQDTLAHVRSLHLNDGQPPTQQRAFSRHGGEEFLVSGIFDNHNAFLIAAEQIREAVEKTPVQLDNGQTLNCSVSIGITKLDGDKTVSAGLKEADNALYEAKRRGRNVVWCAEDSGDSIRLFQVPNGYNGTALLSVIDEGGAPTAPATPAGRAAAGKPPAPAA